MPLVKEGNSLCSNYQSNFCEKHSHFVGIHKNPRLGKLMLCSLTQVYQCCLQTTVLGLFYAANLGMLLHISGGIINFGILNEEAGLAYDITFSGALIAIVFLVRESTIFFESLQFFKS